MGKRGATKTWLIKSKNPKAVRAVGGANGKNPIGIIIPCHRVIQKDGSIGGYTSGTDTKRKLLKIEDVYSQIELFFKNLDKSYLEKALYSSL